MNFHTKKIIIKCNNPANDLQKKISKYSYINLTISADEKQSELTLEDFVVSVKSFLCAERGKCDFFVTNVKFEIMGETSEKLVINVLYDYET